MAELLQVARQPIGQKDVDQVLGHLVDVALGSPATCALPALSRIAPTLSLNDPALLTAATMVGMAFRTLFNQPETQALLRAEGDVYWRAVLRHAAEHDLQTVLDEYAHVLLEAEGQVGHPPVTAIRSIAERMVEALSLRPPQIELAHYALQRGRIVQTHPIILRGRFAMRLAQKGEDETGVNRTGLVRTAFNSPFMPFVLASTSVGQEGLDFHPYCHRIDHWNLPGTPVDMEQREGRVHRYKNHAVRLNLVAGHSPAALGGQSADPWADMFSAAHGTAGRTGDLEPFWVLHGPTKVERHILSLPFNREETRLPWLNRSVALYRLAFGQPRQDGLLALLDQVRDETAPEALAQLQISLRPE
ncbi:MAG: helicase-related protein [Salipiger marinus]|uniref:helicase-related protein n=1 Tax=Salipiger marinus TaxID=555512 RepID=UPI004059E98A